MSIPVNALKDDELLHYAALEPAAAAELARRIADSSLDPGAEREELRDDIRHLESRAEEAEDETERLRDDVEEACELIRCAMDPDDDELSVPALLKKPSTYWSDPMSTFAVFGMTMDLAMSLAKKTTKTTRANPKPGQPAIELSLEDWMLKVERNAEGIMGGAKLRQLSPAFDAPQFARQFIELARKTGRCRDLKIRARVELTDAEGKPLINPKTKQPKVGWQDWVEPPKDSEAA